MIEIQLNGAPFQAADNSTLHQLLEQLDLLQKKIALEHNHSIVPRSQFTQVTLASGDQVEVVHAIGGGAV